MYLGINEPLRFKRDRKSCLVSRDASARNRLRLHSNPPLAAFHSFCLARSEPWGTLSGDN